MRTARPGLALAAVTVVFAAACGGDAQTARPLPPARATLTLSSPAFRDGGTIPRAYTCDGAGHSPPLRWRGVPRGTRELALLVEDESAGGFMHWTLARLSPAIRRLAAGRVPPRAVQTENSFGNPHWGGPCPPKGDAPHRYVFALYAAGAPLGITRSSSQDDVRRALAAHAIARGVLTARYGRG